MLQHLDIVFTEIGPDHVSARMPVDWRTHQPAGILHGGASVVLAETVGSVAANLCIDMEHYACVGQEINANHLRAKKRGGSSELPARYISGSGVRSGISISWMRKKN